jgi:adenosylhomocysteine nucleosidase
MERIKSVFKLVLFVWCCLILKVAVADIGVICTLNQELESINGVINAARGPSLVQRQFYTGKVNGINVITVRSPMGKVNNAITAQVLLNHFNITSLVSIGLAGGVSDTVSIGDVVVATESIQHDVGTIKPYGFIWSPVTHMDAEAGQNGFKKWVENSGLRTGRLASGDQFIADLAKRKWIAQKLNAIAVDTNSAAINQVCIQNSIPCGFIRQISDEAGVNARGDFERLARNTEMTTVDVLKQYLEFETR